LGEGHSGITGTLTKTPTRQPPEGPSLQYKRIERRSPKENVLETNTRNGTTYGSWSLWLKANNVFKKKRREEILLCKEKIVCLVFYLLFS
jgi:hypothetical protein